MSKRILNLSIPEHDYQQLKALCTHHGDLAHIIRTLIREFLKRKGKLPQDKVGERE